MPALFMTELAVADPAASAAWYHAALGLTVEMADPRTGFTLLADGAGGRVAVKPGRPAAGGVTLHFRVTNLDAELDRLSAIGVRPDGPPARSAEGYRAATVRDPDGYAVGLFEWAAGVATTPMT